MSDVQAWLDQVEARLEAVKNEPTGAAWSNLYQHAPDDLARAHHIITRMVQTAENHPDPCGKHPDGDPVTCGWKSAYASVIWALKGQDR